MTLENIRLNGSNGQLAFEKYNGYYYIMDNVTGALLVRTDDGHTAFLYPLDTTLTYNAVEIHYDGYYFWTMSQITNGVRFRKWFIQDFLCKQQSTFDLTTTASDNYGTTTDRPSTFAIEHYHRKLTAPATAGQDHVHLDSVDRLDPADSPVIYIGPNSSGEYDEKTVTSLVGLEAHFSGTLDHNYDADTMVHFARRIWLFNNHYGTVVGGSLMELGLTGSVINRTSGAQFLNVGASTFAAYNYYGGSTVKPFLMFMKSSLLNFVDVSSATVPIPITMSSVQDVYKNSDPTAQWSVYSVCIEDNYSDQETDVDIKKKRDTIFRLQDGATYFTTDYSWSATNLNYAITTIKPYINSISLSAVPAVVPADSGLTTSAVTAYVKDQYNNAVVSGTVNFTSNATLPGHVDPVSDTLDANGAAHTTYETGAIDQLVTVTAAVTQIII